MAYKLLVSIRAQNEIEKTIEYYSLRSENAPMLFIESLEKAYEAISINPNYEIRYKNIRSFKINKFPFLLFFAINIEEKEVKILSCFHSKLNPKKRPK
jgi:hypothetical protein